MMESLLPNFRTGGYAAGQIHISSGGKTYDYGDLPEDTGAQMAKLGSAPIIPSAGRNGGQVTDNRQVHVQVQIETAVTQDSAGMRLLADEVADRIIPAVEHAMGGDSNSYSDW